MGDVGGALPKSVGDAADADGALFSVYRWHLYILCFLLFSAICAVLFYRQGLELYNADVKAHIEFVLGWRGGR